MATVKLQVEIDDGLWRRFRSHLIHKGVTSKAIVAQLIEQYLQSEQSKQSSTIEQSEDRNRKD